MIKEKIIFTKYYDEHGSYGAKEVEGLVLDKYRDVSDAIGSPHPCDYYLVEMNDGKMCSVRPHEVVKRIKN